MTLTGSKCQHYQVLLPSIILLEDDAFSVCHDIQCVLLSSIILLEDDNRCGSKIEHNVLLPFIILLD